MNRRVRRQRKRNDSFGKYLKPGALAKLRDSKVSARSQKLTCSIASLPSPPLQAPRNDGIVTSIQIHSVEQLPNFGACIRGPQCFGRKKLVAAKSRICFVDLNGAGSGHVLDAGSVSLINVANSDLLVH